MNKITRKTVAVIFGGRSAEHDVSIITAHNPIIESLLAIGTYEVMPVYISKKGIWYSDPKMNDVAFFKNPEYEKELEKTKPVSISVNGAFELIWPGLRDKRVKIDVVFPSMHGTFGEDGSLMGLLRMANVPFVGCDLFASAVAMDKVLTKDLVKSNGVPVVPHVWFTASDWADKAKRATLRAEILKLMKEEIPAPTPVAEPVVETVAVPAEPIAADVVAVSETSGASVVVPAPAPAPTPAVAPKPTYKIHPMFVKPVHLGSSIGITKVKTEKELDNAIEVALHYDDKVLVEVGVENLIEVTLPMIGNEVVEFAAIERTLNKGEFFDYNEKYLVGGKKSGGVNSADQREIPAKIGDELSARVREIGEKTYKTLGCSGIARVDMLINSVTNTVYMNEVNTLPGSLYAHNWRRVGVSNVDLITKLIGFAEARFTAQNKVTHVFNSSILQKAGGGKKLGN